MWEEILKTALESGLWAVLFCVLLMYQLRDGRARENKYRATVDALIDRLSVLDRVAQDADETVTLLRERAHPSSATEKIGRRTEVRTEVADV